MIRVLKVLAVYALVGSIVWFGAEPIRRTFLLPGLFTTATRWLLVAFLPFALAVAWRYPSLGAADQDTTTDAGAAKSASRED